jgi:hypothetical protein
MRKALPSMSTLSPGRGFGTSANRQTRQEVEDTLFEHIMGFCNPRRKKSDLGWKAPMLLKRGPPNVYI